MNKTVKFWLRNLYKNEIEEIKGTMRNEHLWELGYDGEDPNPHTENLMIQKEYLQVLEKKLKELDDA